MRQVKADIADYKNELDKFVAIGKRGWKKAQKHMRDRDGAIEQTILAGFEKLVSPTS